MKPGFPVFLLMTFAGMELCWVYALNLFFLSLLTNHVFPLFAAVLSYGGALGLTALLKGRGLRRFWSLGFHALGFYITIGLAVKSIFARSPGVLNPFRIKEMVTGLPVVDRCALILVVLGLLVCWLKGRFPGKTCLAHQVVCRRFDAGLAAFAVLFLIQFIIQVKGFGSGADTASVLLFGFFLILGLGAVVPARNQQKNPTEFIHGYGAMALGLGLAVVFLIVGAAVVIFWMPYLSRAATAGYGLLKETASPLAPVIIGILRFLFGYHRIRQGNRPIESADNSSNRMDPASGGAEPGVWENMLLWGLVGAACLCAVLVVAWLAVFVLRYLFTPTHRSELVPVSLRPIWVRFLSLWKRIRQIPGLFWPNAEQVFDAAGLYARLTRWGGHSGLPLIRGETPQEYGRRLARVFPVLGAEVDLVLTSIQHQIYGGRRIDARQIALTQRAWRKMKSPLRWPLRFWRLLA